MSVEKIAALNQAMTDGATMRALNGSSVGHGRAPAPFPPLTPPATAEGAPNLMQRLSRLPTAPHLDSLRRRKPHPSRLRHKHHL